MFTERLSVTNKAIAVIDQLREKHGELMFHQSGGCCDGSAPMCFEKGEFFNRLQRFMPRDDSWL